MKLLLKSALCTLTILLFLTSCSRKKNTFLSRNFHAVTTEYNTLYNGQVALDEGKDALIQNFNDDYWQVLPIERIAFDDSKSLGEDNRDPKFGRAEEKAIKAIQRHSMQIDNEEVNPQMDEAFILLGKARYYDQQFVPALEAFNYILAYYPKSNNIAQAKVWKAKTNIRLENNELAIDNLNTIFKVEGDLKDQDIADAKAMLAQAYLNLEQPDSALVYIKEASRLTRKFEEKGRYSFIKGQLYKNLGYKDSATMAFQEVIDLNRKIPRKYHINAHIEQIRQFDVASGDTLEIKERLDKLVENRENRPFLDKLYYTKADFFLKTGKKDSAIANYNKSLRQQGADQYLNSRDYLALADYNFDNAAYKVAGAYYDSVIGLLNDKGREIRIIKKKRENLTDVITYEDLTKRNDSILKLATMTDDDLSAYFTKYIADIKAKEIQDSINRVEKVRNNEFFASSTPLAGRGQGKVGEFYFYNTTAVAYGKQTFQRRWGKRRLEDGWRLSSAQVIPLNATTLPSIPGSSLVSEEVVLTVEDYIAQIPREEKQIDSLRKERDFAYFQLGLIYKEKFKEYPLAAERLETLLTYDPEEKLLLPSKYNLYQIYGEMDILAKAEQYKNDITSNYPDSRYASRLNNPNVALEEDAQAPDVIYKGLYREFQNQQYQGLLSKLDTQIDKFYGDPYLPKFELLKATVLGRYEGYSAYKDALNYVALTYPRSEEGKRAQQLLSEALPGMAFTEFDDEALSVSYKLLYEFPATNTQAALDFKTKLEEVFDNVGYSDFNISLDSYTKDISFIVVHFLSSRGQAEGVIELLATHKDSKIVKPAIIVASENYKFVQLHKNLEAYKTRTTN